MIEPSLTRNVYCLRAGVAGLTTALLLTRGSKYQITVAAKHMPGVFAYLSIVLNLLVTVHSLLMIVILVYLRTMTFNMLRPGLALIIGR